ncbi:hypothetical protein G9A89_017639 [Geosiphon pyriformis]|nr:hypothetical protein G9A89_017639 [Geosiphon pyriformis]
MKRAVWPSSPKSASTVQTFINGEQSEKLLNLFEGRVLVVTGAGVSTDSGIPDYRGPNGTYIINKTYKPIFYHEFAAHHRFRQRYWARSYIGWPQIQKARPNITHYALAQLQSKGYIDEIITQNVDSLHQEAQSQNILELHGTLNKVHCLQCGNLESRTKYQQMLSDLNPIWAEFSRHIEASDIQQRMNPDGDADLPSTSYETFKYPSCVKCRDGVYKPSVVFFGENIIQNVKQRAAEIVQQSDSMLIIGSSLTTYSAYRLVKLGHDLGKKIGIINLGPTRGDHLAIVKVEEACGTVLPSIVNAFSKNEERVKN